MPPSHTPLVPQDQSATHTADFPLVAASVTPQRQPWRGPLPVACSARQQPQHKVQSILREGPSKSSGDSATLCKKATTHWASHSMVDGRTSTSWRKQRKQIDGTSGDSFRRSSPAYYNKTSGACGNSQAAWSGWRRRRHTGSAEEVPASTAPGPPTGRSHQSLGGHL